MRIARTRTLAVTVLAAAAVGLTAPAAFAGGNNDPVDIVVHPTTIVRGGALSITVEGTACQNGQSYVTSDVFPKTFLVPRRNSNTSYATATIDSNAPLGTYRVTAHCGSGGNGGSDDRRGDAGGSGGDGSGTATGGTFNVVAGNAARGGLGGTTGPGTAEMAVGGGLAAAAAVGGGVYLMRRRVSGGLA
jgi:hypothetical protein